MRLSSFKTDTARAESGDWIEMETMPGVAFKVRGRNTVAAKALRAKLAAAIPIEDRADREKMIRHQERIESEIVLSCLDGWRGLTDDAGAPLEFTSETAKSVLLDPDFTRLTAVIGGACDRVQEWKEAAIEDAAKK